MKKRRVDFLALLTIFGITIFFFLPLFYPHLNIFVTPDFGLSDVVHYTYPVRQLLSESIKSGVAPIWNKNLGMGYPLFAEGQIGFFYFYNQIAFRLLPSVLAVNLGYVFTFLTAAIGTYVFLRLLKLFPLISLFGAISFAFSGWFVTQIPHFNVIQSVSLLPWIFVLAHLIFYHQKKLLILVLAVVVSQQIFLGFPQMVFISFFGAFCYLLVLSYQAKCYQPLIYLIFAYLIALPLSAVQLMPSYELLTLSQRTSGFALSGATYFSYPWGHLKTLIWPYALGNPAFGTYPDFKTFNGSVFWENTGYFGALVFFISIYALFLLKKTPWAVTFALLAFGSLILMTGKNSPLYLIYSFPPLSFFRVPSRFLVLFVFSMVTLASFGLQQLTKVFKEKVGNIQAQIMTIVVIAISFIQLINFGRSYNPVGLAEKWLSPPPTVKALSSENRYLSLQGSDFWNRQFARGWQNRNQYQTLLAYLQPNFNLLYHTPSIEIYPTLPTRRHQLLMSLIYEGVSSKGGMTVLSPEALRLLELSDVGSVIMPDKLGKAVVTKLNPVPYGRVVYRSQKASSINQLLTLMKEPGGSDSVVIEEAIAYDNGLLGRSTTQQITHTDRVSVFEVNSSQPGIFVRSESFYPGWQATVNGKLVKIFAANINSQAILIPQGKSKVVFSYNPRSFVLGRQITLVSYFIVLLAVFLGLFLASASVYPKLLLLIRRENNPHKDH